MNFLLGIDKSQYGDAIIKTEGLAETFIFGGQILLIGMVTVFSVLALLFACLTVFKIVFHDIPNKQENSAQNEVAVDEDSDGDYINSDDSEIVAVIAAAIAAAESESNNAAKFKVVSFRRK